MGALLTSKFTLLLKRLFDFEEFIPHPILDGFRSLLLVLTLLERIETNVFVSFEFNLRPSGPKDPPIFFLDASILIVVPSLVLGQLFAIWNVAGLLFF